MDVAAPLEDDMRFAAFLLGLLMLPAATHAELYGIIIQGLGGLPKYSGEFGEQAEGIQKALDSLDGSGDVLLISGDEAQVEVLEAFFVKLSGELGTDDRVAVFLVGHGSYDGNEYKFNIPGPDITGEKLRELMDGLPASRQLVVVTGSSSGALLDTLTRDDRTVITATRSGAERNATSFGKWFAEALVSGTADINKNEYVSVQEAYDYAARAVEEHFDSEGTLATEHSQVTGDGAIQFNLARLAPDEPVEISPEAGELIGRRNELDERILDLQLRRSDMTTEAYYQEIEVLMLELARIEEDLEIGAGEKAGEETGAETEEGIEDGTESENGDIDDIIAAGIDVGMGTGIGEDLEIIGMDLLGEGLLEDSGDIDDAEADMESDTSAAAVENGDQDFGDD